MYIVLIVEGEDIIRRGVHDSVPWEAFGCIVVREARNGEEGTALTEQLTPDIITTDINMPVVDGLQMLSQTKETFDYVAIVLAGYSDSGYTREAIHCGAVCYVLKPLDMEEMRRALEKAVLEVKNIAIIRRQTKSIHQLKNVSLLPVPDSREKTDPMVDQVLDFTTANYERGPSPADLGAELHHSERYISQRFQGAMGTMMTDYLNRYRIQKAPNLLKEYGTPISNIGWRCSTGDYKYSCYVSKKYMGCSPKDHQASVKS